MSEPDLFATPADEIRHWLSRISTIATIPDDVAAAIPSDQPEYVSWLLCAVSLSKIYADAALASNLKATANAE